MQSVGSILKKFNPTEDKYVSREFQSFGVHLSEVLDDPKHKSLYIKLAKTHPRAVLEKALRFCIDSSAKNKGALFMWKLQQLMKMTEKPKVINLKELKPETKTKQPLSAPALQNALDL